jgi:endoglucanase
VFFIVAKTCNELIFKRIKMNDVELSYNQYGYPSGAPKIASIQKDAPGPYTWVLKDVLAGSTIAQGTTLPPIKDSFTGDIIHRADFSNIQRPGTYIISIDEKSSAPFRIGNDIYAQLRRDALHFFYLMRSGIELNEAFAGKTWARKPGHLSDADIRAFAGTDAQGTKWQGYPFRIDGSGGWYDAGDFGKYVVNGGISVWTLQNAYERFPSYFSDGDQNIPEQRNGIPDILDECRWELEFMLRMQIPEGFDLSGMAFHKLHDRTWSGVPAKLPIYMNNNNDMQDGAAWGRFVFEPSTAATLNLAATAAQAARLWKPYDKNFANRCLESAERAWKAACKHPDLLAGNVPGEGGGNYDDTNVLDEFYWAACELFVTTGKAEYETYLRSSIYFTTFQGLHDQSASSMTWTDTAALGSITLLTAETSLPEAEKKRIRELIIQTAVQYEALQAVNGYAIPMGISGFVWGSNSVVLNNAIIMALAYDFTGNKTHLFAVSRSMDYILGNNGLKKSFISGYGPSALSHPHHRVWANDPAHGYPPPPPGALAGGPNAQIQDPVAEAHHLISRPIPFRYVDEIGSFATNEVAINWNAPLLWVASFLDSRYTSIDYYFQ